MEWFVFSYYSQAEEQGASREARPRDDSKRGRSPSRDKVQPDPRKRQRVHEGAKFIPYSYISIVIVIF